MATLQSILSYIKTLSIDDNEFLKTILLAKTKYISMEDFVREERFVGGEVCPLCGCKHISRNGRTKKGKQRYICKDCGRSFVATSNSVVARSRKHLIVWERYIDCMMGDMTVRKTAQICGIHKNTALFGVTRSLMHFRKWQELLFLMVS